VIFNGCAVAHRCDEKWPHRCAKECGERSKRSEKKKRLMNKKLSKSNVKIILKSITMIRILPTESLKTIILLVILIIKFLIKEIDSVP
jgi:uncharacterized membrane protein YvbJ